MIDEALVAEDRKFAPAPEGLFRPAQ